MGWYDENDPRNKEMKRVHQTNEVFSDLASKEIGFWKERLARAEALIAQVADSDNWMGINVWIGDIDIVLAAKQELDFLQERPPEEWLEEAMEKLNLPYEDWEREL